MDIIEKHLSFVKEQQSIQEKLARKYEDQPWRSELHAKSAAHFGSLADDLVLAQQQMTGAPTSLREFQPPIPSSNIFVTAKDIEGLPAELLRELSLSETDKLEFTIASVIEENGGILSLDKLLIGLYRRTGDIVRRNTLTSRLYRMAQRNQIFPVPGKKGIYATRPISEEAMRGIPGREEPDVDEEGVERTVGPRFSFRD